jgi:hypothetical protein
VGRRGRPTPFAKTLKNVFFVLSLSGKHFERLHDIV